MNRPARSFSSSEVPASAPGLPRPAYRITLAGDSAFRGMAEIIPRGVGDDRLLQSICEELTTHNPAYDEAVKYGRPTWGLDEALTWYAPTSAGLAVPMAYAPRAVQILGPQRVQVEDRTVHHVPRPMRARFDPRTYQQPAIKDIFGALQRIHHALLIAPAGSGKTEIALAVAAMLGQPMLWLTHTKDLADQARQRAIARLGIPAEQIGMIGSGEFTIGRFLTVALVQTLCKIDPERWAGEFGLIAQDECHHAPTVTAARVLNACGARYRLGLTATPERSDGLGRVLEWHFGPPAHVIERAATLGSGTITPTLRTVESGWRSDTWELHKRALDAYESFHGRSARDDPNAPKIDFNELMAEMVESDERNTFLAELIAREAVGRKSLVLAARVEHCEILAMAVAEWNPFLRRDVIHGGTSRKKRGEILDRARAGEVDLLFGVNLPKEGLDIPCLDQLFVIGGGRDKIKIEQSVGRIQRASPGKTSARVVDVLDEHIGVLKSQFWARRSVYKKIGMIGR